MSDTWDLRFALPQQLRGRFASLADDAGMPVEEYLARLLVDHARATFQARPDTGVHLTRKQLEDRVVAAAIAGRTTRHIAQDLGLTNQRVNDIRRRHGVGTNTIGGPRAA